MKTVSSAAIIVVDGKVLICKTRFNKKWDFPKGKVEEGETSLETAIRETMEETGTKLKKHMSIYSSPILKYRPGKDVAFHIFVLNKSEIPYAFNCTSEFEYKGKMYPEIDEFKFVDIDELNVYLYDNLCKALNGDDCDVNYVLNFIKIKKLCQIINFQFSWELNVDGKSILFSSFDAAEYFKNHYSELGYYSTIRSGDDR